MKLRQKLLLLILVPIIVVTVASSFYSYMTTRSLLEHQLYRTDQFKSAEYSSKVNEQLLKYENAIKELAVLVASPAIRATDLNAFVQTAAKADADFFNVMLIFHDGRYINSSGVALPQGFDVRTVDWYKETMVMDGSTVHYSEVYKDVGTNEMVTTVSIPIKENGQSIGVVAMDIEISKILSIVQEMKTGETGYVFVVDQEGNFLAHPQYKATDQMQTIHNGEMNAFYQRLLKEDYFTTLFNFDGKERLYSARNIGNTSWNLCTSMETNELFAQVDSMATTLMISAVLTMVLLGGIVLYVVKDISKIAGMMIAATNYLANGDFSEKPRKISRRDEFGEMAGTLADMRTKVRLVLERISSASEQLAASSQELTAGADQSAQASSQVADSITAVANGSEKQLAAIGSVEQNIKVMADLIANMVKEMDEISKNANATAVHATKGNEAVEHAIAQMKSIQNTVGASAEVVAELGQRSAEIGQIVDTISGIAGQTNLLALNAAIEAARAGEQGKGFAVVAEEVRKLAEQSQEASGHIADLIRQIQEKTDQAVESMNNGTREVSVGNEVVEGTGKLFKEIGDMIMQANQSIGDIQHKMVTVQSSNKEIVGMTQDINVLSQEAAREAQNVSAATEEQAASMEQMSSGSQSLATLAQGLREQVGQFKIR